MNLDIFIISLAFSLPSWIVITIFIMVKSIKEKSTDKTNKKWQRIIIGSLASIPFTLMVMYIYATEIPHNAGNAIIYLFVFYLINFIPLTLIYLVILWLIEKCMEQVKQ